jgi:uncharacterized SAM-dependent methyltransferase
MEREELVSAEALERELAECLRRSELPDHFLYLGEAGVAGWLELAESAEFDIAARLEDLLRESVAELADELPACCDVVSVGVGSGRKERLILEALRARGGRPRYFPIDISAPLVDMAAAEVAHLAPEGRALVAPLAALPRLAARHFRTPMLLCLLGNNSCNHEPEWLLPMLRRQLGPGDHLLLDFHLAPSDPEAARAQVEARYGGELNRAFNLGPLTRRGLDPAACELSLEVVACQGLGCRTRKGIRIRRRARVRCGQEVVELREGTRLTLGFTYKYAPGVVEGLLARHGFEVRRRAASAEGDFLILLLRTTGP